ncbi:MAG: ABC transporter ATP-binding protein [Methylocystis sp.]|uniref:ABC transporter ATP-binding protein n=1 Tax=Methylocystis sp. TaxID=1911079 RepID=UPI00392E9F99
MNALGATEARQTAPALVALRAVGKTFPSGLVALADYDLDVREGEVLTLLGPSGCGKSTVLRLIAGLARPTAGSIDWRAPDSKNNIGFVFQDATLLPWASVFDNVFLPLRLGGFTREAAAARVEEALAHVGLADFSGARPRELSGGMRMRCAIARALVTRPALIMMDEPFAALDEVTRFKLNDDLLALKRRLGATIVFVTHSVFEAAYLSTRILVMSRRGGRIIDEIEIDPAIARDDDYRSSKMFSDICRQGSQALRLAIEEATP